jgi:septum formation protein
MTQGADTGAAAPPSVVLASASAARAALLRNAGIVFRVDPADIDEGELKRALHTQDTRAAEAAETLAELKAAKVSRRHKGDLVIGADQMLECGHEWFDKPADIDHARAHLMTLRGKTHELISAVAVAQDGVRLWHHVDRARLHMRDFSNSFLDRYLAAMGGDGKRGLLDGRRLPARGSRRPALHPGRGRLFHRARFAASAAARFPAQPPCGAAVTQACPARPYRGARGGGDRVTLQW